MSNAQVGQKDAVVNLVTEILGANFTPGQTVVKDAITQEQLTELRERVLQGITGGTIAFNGDASDLQAVRRYVNGMIQNHFRKAKELNGGGKYQPANPGSGRRDPQLSNLKKLLKQYESNGDQEKAGKVLAAIEARNTELEALRKASAADRRRSKAAEGIDTSVLPAELSGIVNQASAP